MRIFVIWEPVLPSDWTSPSTATLARISDARVTQFWDHDRLISHSMGEHDRRTVRWDLIAIYPPGIEWGAKPPPAMYHDGPVVRVIDEARSALTQAVQAQ